MSESELDPEFLQRVAALSIEASRGALGHQIGPHESPREGSSIVFAEHREYRPMDDPRRIDMRAWARTDRPTIKRFEHESDRLISLLIDRSPSMDFRSEEELPTKYEWARLFASGLAFLHLRSGERVMLSPYDDEPLGLLHERRGVATLGELIRPLFEPLPKGRKTSLKRAVEGLRELPRKSALIIISDFLEDDLLEAIASLRGYAARGVEIQLVQLFDPAEARFSFDRAARVEGCEGEEPIEVTPDRALEAAYNEAIAAHLASVQNLALTLGARVSFFETSHDPVLGLSSILRMSSLRQLEATR